MGAFRHSVVLQPQKVRTFAIGDSNGWFSRISLEDFSLVKSVKQPLQSPTQKSHVF